MTNPKLTSDLSIPDPGAGWQPRTPFSDNTTATGSDRSGITRAVIQDGQVVGIQTGKSQRSSTDALAIEANSAERTPYVRAVDGRTSQPLMPHQLKDDSVLWFPDGSQVTVEQARSLGWFLPGPRPQPTNGAPNRPFDQSQQAPKEEVHPDLRVDLLANEAMDRDYSALVDSTGGVEQQQAIQQVVENGEIDPRTLGTLASQLRVEPDQLRERIAPIMEAFKQQALDVMSAGGLDGNAVVAWAQQHKPDKFQQAMRQQGTMRQTSGYAELRTEYLGSLAEHSPSMALNADLGSGISQYQDTKGRIIVRLADGNEMEWRTALTAFGIRKS